MGDGRFSLDDILNEYPKNNSSENVSGINLENIMDSYNNDKPSDTVADNSDTIKTDKTEKIDKPKTSDITEKLPIKDSTLTFSKKFDTIASNSLQREILDSTAKPKPAETVNQNTGLFSLPEKNTDDEKLKTSGIDFANYKSTTSGIDLNSILDEYASDEAMSKMNSHNKNSAQQEQPRGLTGLFNKIKNEREYTSSLKKAEKSAGLSQHTELLDEMIKLKKDRSSRTSHIPPIERKSISDINLNLNDKILPDTTQIKIAENQAEIDKINALNERRNKKVNEFVFVGDEEESEETDENESEEKTDVIDDFEKLEDAPSIASDIVGLKKTLVIRLLVLIVCFVASLYIALMNDSEIVPMINILNKKTETSTFLFANSVIGLIAAFASYTVISCGIGKLLKFKADGDSLVAVAMVTSIISSMVMLGSTNLIKGSLAHDYVPVAIGALLFNTIGKLLIVSRTQRNFKYVSGTSEKYAVVNVEDEEKAQAFTRGALNDFPSLAILKKTELISDFLKSSYSPDATDSFCKILTPIILGVSLIIAVVASFSAKKEFGTSEIYIALSVFVGCISICSSFGMLFVVNLPMEKASRKYSEYNGAIIGYNSIEEFSDTNSIMVDAEQLFPQGCVSLSAIKTFSDTRIDEAIVEAASLTHHSNSILKNMFYDIIAGKTEMLNPVESYIFEDSMGLCGWINNKRVLLGNRELMINHSIEGLPSEKREKEYSEHGKIPVYLSISGELSAMFVIELTSSIEVSQSLNELQKSKVFVIVRSVDSCISINRISELYNVSPELIKILPFRMHKDYQDITEYNPKISASLACSGSFSALSALITGTKRLKGTIFVGLGIQALAVALALIIFMTMVILKSFGELNVFVVISYNLIFTALLLAFQTIRRV